MEIDKNKDYTILTDSLSFNFVYGKDELAVIYARRDEYKNNKAETLSVEDFVKYVRQDKV